jgi:hypothetical protein
LKLFKVVEALPLLTHPTRMSLKPNRNNNVVVILIGRDTKSKFLSVTKNVQPGLLVSILGSLILKADWLDS